MERNNPVTEKEGKEFYKNKLDQINQKVFASHLKI